MRATFAALLLIPLLLAFSGCSQHHVAQTASGKTVYGEQAQIIERLRDAGKDLQQLMNAPDSAVPKEVMDSAKCIAVVPDMVKGGFVVGGTHGRGVATCRANGSWSEPAFFVVTGGSWGAQIGLEAVDLVMVITNDEGMQQLLSSQFKLGADAGVAAGPVGRQASANTDWKMKSKVLMYSRSRGLFAGLDLNGAVIKPDADSTVTFYGRDVPANELLAGKGPRNPNADLFLREVQQAYSEAKASSGL